MTRLVARAASNALLILLATLTGLVLCQPVAAAGLMAVPAQVSFGAVNASVQPLKELTGGVNVFLPPASETGSAPAVSIALKQPLRDPVSGSVLPAGRLRVGVNDLRPFGPSGTVTVVAGQELLRLRIAVELGLFDPPGVYEGQLALMVGQASSASELLLPVRVEVSKWANIRLSGAGFRLAAPGGVEPGPDSFLSTGEASGVEVASNCRWQLAAQVANDAAPDLQGIFADYRIRVLKSSWTSPTQEGFLRLAGGPVVLASGGPTASCGTGWVPLGFELRLPFDRTKVAGSYVRYLSFSVIPL